MTNRKTQDELHDRIDRVEGVNNNYKSALVHIIISQELANTFRGQLMVIVASNMIGRWANNITISVPSVECVLKKYKGLLLPDVLKNAIHSVKPDCNLSLNNTEIQSGALVLCIGDAKLLSMEEYTWIDCNGWLAGYGNSISEDYSHKHFENIGDTPFLIGASFAVCLGVSEVFRRAIGNNVQKFEKWFSLFDYASANSPIALTNPSEYDAQIDIGTVHQIGCGAIGSAFDYFLSLSENVIGNLLLIDHDPVEIQNLPNSMVFEARHYIHNVKKVIACKGVFENHHLDPQPFPTDYSEFKEEGHYKENIPDIILCFANERNIWPVIQYNYPPVVMHATTNKSWGTNFGRHIPQKDWCIMCRFQDELAQEFSSKAACSEGNVSANPQREVLGMLPFLAPTSALITLAEIYKLHSQKLYLNNSNFVEFSMRNMNGDFMDYTQPAKNCNVCKEQSIDIYPQAITTTKHWHLSISDQAP